MLLLSIAKWRDSLNSQSLVYDGDRQAPPDLSNLLPEETDLDPDTWPMRHESMLAFLCRIQHIKYSAQYVSLNKINQYYLFIGQF